MDLLLQPSGNIPLSSLRPPASTPRLPKNQNSALTKQAFNHHIKELKQYFNSEVDSIALEFSRQGAHHSCHQIKKQILFTMSQPNMTCKPTAYNAWQHTESQAEKIECMYPLSTVKASRLILYAADAFPSLPYSDEYMSLLKDIKVKNITYEDVKGETPEQEHHQSVLFQGLCVKQEEQGAKKNIISPELSLHRMSEHAQKELVKVVSIWLGL